MKTTDELTHELLLTDKVNMGHDDLKQWLDAAFCAGLDKAVQILRREINTCHGNSDDCQPCVALQNSIVDIEAYRDRHGKKRECSICKGNGFIDVEKYDRVEQEDCRWCGTTGIEPQPPMPDEPSASDRLPND